MNGKIHNHDQELHRVMQKQHADFQTQYAAFQTHVVTPPPCASFAFAFGQAQTNGNAAYAREHRSPAQAAIAYARAYIATMRAYGFEGG